jgi:hypothetical protein
MSVHKSVWHLKEFILKNIKRYVGFEVLTAVGMKSTIFWDITPCSPLSVNWRFKLHSIISQKTVLFIKRYVRF